jgi:hypothetical protein
MYAKNQLKVQWDKKRIKEALFDFKLSEQKRKYPSSEIVNYAAPTSYLMRDLLGLASDSNWFGEYRDAIKTENIADKKENIIDRFQSPVFFKPIEIHKDTYRVYFQGDQNCVDTMLSKRFRISNKSGKSVEMSTPPKFDIDDFFRYAFSINIENHISQKGGGYSPEKELLVNLYAQVRMNAGIFQR